jgi:hypothetical protein
MYKATRRYGLQSTLFALDPWTIIKSSIQRRCPAHAQSEAVASLEQAQDFYKVATTAGIVAARPLLLYYCFMNLTKAYALTVGQRPTFNQAQHGISEKLGAGGVELIDAYLEAYRSPNARTGAFNLFDEFLEALSGTALSVNQNFHLKSLLPQILPGHRLWAEAANQTERFISLESVQLFESARKKQIWLLLYLFADDLTRLGVTHRRLLEESQLLGKFRQVKTERSVEGRKLICFEQIQPRAYTHRASDEVAKLVADAKRFLWATVASVPPYRRYYVYLAPPAEHSEVLPQLLSIYAITHYLGSITRYRPQHFDVILKGDFGPRIEEFISGQPLQFIYLMASEFAEQEVTKPSIV